LGSLNQRQSEVHAQVEVDTQEILLADARQSLERDVENAVRNLGTRWRQYIIAQRARDLSRRKLEIEREKLQAGRSSNFQVLSFEADLRSAESARLNALIAYLNAQADLDQTLGTTLESWDIDLKD
jgi:outer membrane protein TolC